MAEAPAPAPGPAPAPAPTNPAASKVRKMPWGAISSIMKKAKADAPPPPAPQPRGQPPKDKNKDKKKWNGKHELVDGVWQGRWEGAEEKEEIGEQPEEAARRREQQESWKETLPWLSVEKKKRCAVPGCTGCNLCALLFCTLCIDRMTPPCANSTCNKFCSVGCDWFQLEAVKRHAALYERWVREGAVKYVQSIMDGLETRFPDDDKLSALCIFDFTRLPSTQEQWDA